MAKPKKESNGGNPLSKYVTGFSLSALMGLGTMSTTKIYALYDQITDIKSNVAVLVKANFRNEQDLKMTDLKIFRMQQKIHESQIELERLKIQTRKWSKAR